MPKDIGKFGLDDDEIEALGGTFNTTPPQGTSRLVVLKDLLGDLQGELEELDQRRQNVLNRILTINQIFTEKVKAQKVEDSAAGAPGGGVNKLRDQWKRSVAEQRHSGT